MSNSDDFAAMQAAIEALPDERLKSPALPIDTFLQEAENLYTWCQEDKEQLVQASLDWALVEKLPVLCGALRQAESMWFKDRFTREEAEKIWKEKSPAAYDLRNQLLHDFHFAYRNSLDLTGRVRRIAEGNGHADMIQDLNDMAELGKANSTQLNAIGFNLEQLELAASTSDEMAQLLSMATTERASDNQARIIRDKAFTLLKETVDEIRQCGQYIFWRDPQRFKGYISFYHKRWNNQPKDAEIQELEEE